MGTAEGRETKPQQAVRLAHEQHPVSEIATLLGISSATAHRWVQQQGNIQPRGAPARLSPDQCFVLAELMEQGAVRYGYQQWSNETVADFIAQTWQVSYHPTSIPNVMRRVRRAWREGRGPSSFQRLPFATLYQGDAVAVLPQLADESVDCIVTSPPYYGQRDYGIHGQLGLEPHPQQYLDRLVYTFDLAKRVLKKSGSLWVNIGDTYWSGKGRAQGHDSKQKHRRFDRPQDKTGPRPWCAPKQLLLIPQRFAIAMQENGWLVRNEIIWQKTLPMPDPVADRCSITHEHIYHFVRQKTYYYNMSAVATLSNGKNALKPPGTVWQIGPQRTGKQHSAPFPEEVVSLPIRATCPPSGVLLDPFCGSGTALAFALSLGEGRQVIGIDISATSLAETSQFLARDRPSLSKAT